jgi:hypothetical protein
MLLLDGENIVVLRWGARLARIGDGRRYPRQVTTPERVIRWGYRRRARLIRIILRDHRGNPHFVNFFFISYERLAGALHECGVLAA